MQLLLVRHGNTFEEGTPPAWVGSKIDPPLTAKGVKQAESLGSFLEHSKIPVAAIYSGPQLRQRQHSNILAKRLGQPDDTVIVDSRLREIDYGTWEGRTNADLLRSGHENLLNSWNNKAAWPPEGVWGETELSLGSRVSSFLSTAGQGAGDPATIVAVTSSGVLRYFYKQAMEKSRDDETRNSKVSTGNVCGLHLTGLDWRVLYWDIEPDRMPAQLIRS